MLITANNMDIPEGILFLHKHLLDSEQLVEVKNPNTELLDIYGWEVREKIIHNDPEWESQVPNEVVEVIKKENLFCEKSKTIEFEY